MATIWTIDVNEGEEVELTVAEEKGPGMVLMLVSDTELDAALVGVSRANAGRIGAALTHFSKTGELPEEVERCDCGKPVEQEVTDHQFPCGATKDHPEEDYHGE